ncbi:class I SAM-dependent methyltransferase [Streptomyces oceani]|uniref:Methyltransferase domain-containing protein n=1 Tax=Streptomyces oceani TaxID=1075402 RepID=A0A1E7KP30_9ACTN|nr:class I SAM-dependent methyltransferase [Streptomyces oceani]OEV05739.1 hypothetical protein AN216_01925 [Streptomyces oceani]
MNDTYAATAEFFDVLSGPYWSSRGPLVGAALGRAKPEAGPILDVGSGTGHAAGVIARAVPRADIICLEPSPAMRSALTSRILADAALTSRVTVLPDKLEDAELPDRLGGVIAFGVIGSLEEADRRSFWKMLAERLSPGAPAVVDVMNIDATQRARPARVAERQVGRQSYEAWLSVEGDGPDRVRLVMTYRVLRDGTLLREHGDEHSWAALTLPALAAEAEQAGLTCTELAKDVALLRL